MTVLTADLTLTGEIVTVDGPLLVGTAYHLEDEVVVVGGSVTEDYTDVTTGNRWRVRRAQDHTAPATHSSGTALTLAREFESGGAGAGGVTVDNTVDAPFTAETLIAAGATESAPGEATLASGGEQTIRKIGPFAVAHDTAAITGNGAVLTTELVAGAVILTAWAHVTEEWNFGEATFFDIQVAPNSDPGNTWLCTKYATDAGGDVLAIQGDATVLLEASSAPGTAVPLRNIVTVVEASRLVVQTYVIASAGEADIYAIIAEPVA